MMKKGFNQRFSGEISSILAIFGPFEPLKALNFQSFEARKPKISHNVALMVLSRNLNICIDPLINVRFMTILISCKMRFQLFLRQVLYLRKLPTDHSKCLDSYKEHSGLHRVKFSAPYDQNSGTRQLFSSQPYKWVHVAIPIQPFK